MWGRAAGMKVQGKLSDDHDRIIFVTWSQLLGHCKLTFRFVVTFNPLLRVHVTSVFAIV